MDGMYPKQSIFVKPFMNFMEIEAAILQNTKKFYTKGHWISFWSVTIAPMQQLVWWNLEWLFSITIIISHKTNISSHVCNDAIAPIHKATCGHFILAQSFVKPMRTFNTMQQDFKWKMFFSKTCTLFESQISKHGVLKMVSSINSLANYHLQVFY